MLRLILLTLFLQGPLNVQTNVDVQPKLEHVVPTGTGILVTLINRISTKNITEGSGVYAKTTLPVSDGAKIIIPVGTTVIGKVVAAERAGRAKGKARLAISFQSLIFESGLTIPIYASLGGSDTGKRKGEATIEAEPGKETEDVIVAGARGAATGAVIGVASRGVGVGRAIGIGAGAGVAAGLAEALIRRGDDLTLERGTVIEIILDRPVEF